jgi:hypothetical protein
VPASAQRSIASLMAAFRDGDSAAGARQDTAPSTSRDQESAAAASFQTTTATFCPSFSFGVKQKEGAAYGVALDDSPQNADLRRRNRSRIKNLLGINACSRVTKIEIERFGHALAELGRLFDDAISA